MVDNLPNSVQAARVRLGQQRPYLASILFRLAPVAKPGLKTMAVDKYARLYFDPEVNWTVPQTATVLYHEVCHLLRDHAGRSEALGIEAMNHKAWNVCADMEINDDIEAEGKMDWPFTVCTPSRMGEKDGDFAEEYYSRLPKSKVPSPGKGSGEPQPGSGTCGGCAGSPGEWEDSPPASAGGEKDATPGLSPTEMDILRHKVASDIREHVRNRGTVPGHLNDWASLILEPKVDWRKVLKSAIRHAMADIAGMVDYSYMRPSRRQSAVPQVVLPTLRQPVPNIAVVVDTSGSMSDEDIATVLGEINGVLKQCGTRNGVDAIVCDAAVHGAQRVFKAEQIKISGRGGTDMRIGIEAAMARPVKPHAIIVLTDGETPWPEAPYAGTRVVAAIVGNNKYVVEQVPQWIRTVMIEEV